MSGGFRINQIEQQKKKKQNKKTKEKRNSNFPAETVN